MIKLTRIVESLPSSVPFVGPETQERTNNQKFLSRLGANENVFGPSPKVFQAIKNSVNDIWRYADPESYDLKVAIGKHENIKLENIVIGEGIDGLLGYLCRLLVAPKTSVVTSKGAYPTFNYHVSGFGGNLHFVPYKNDYEDIEQLIFKAKIAKAKLVYIANPDNPMGTFHSRTVIEDLVDNLPEDLILCLDEAYSEFVPKNELPKIDPSNPNVIRMRTFSKGYGMAGARIGYAIGESKLIKAFEKIRNHFGINILAQRAALIALQDQDYLNSVMRAVNISKKQIMTIASECGLKSVKSLANFVAVDCGRDASFANSVLQGLVKQRIFVRMPFFSPQSRCIRISAGKPSDLKRLEKIFPKVLNEVNASKSF
ncbi:MAG: histidinol-phosphate aminotransferase [Rhodobacteraceae bacterium]|nr:MAG: histidinol-phosphate aminotransferase [Paracoccaceae bacterium]